MAICSQPAFLCCDQRTRRTEADGTYWVYQYDALGQVISGRKYWADGSPVPGQQLEYGFDDIGNRTSTKAGGDANGANLRSATYSPTPTNTYSSRTVTGAVDVVGLANFQASVTVNSSPADYRRGEYFQELVTTNNGSAPAWLQINVSAVNGGSSSNWPAGYVFVPKTPEQFWYDADGNLLSDGRWTNKWDGENRLVEMLSLTNSPSNSKLWLKFTYDSQGRRIAKQTSIWTNSTWSVVVSNRFLYDGWNLVAELNATNNAVIRRYQWGLDLSDSEQGAGGVGGLLSILYLPTPSSCFVAYDGNGNVAGLVDVMTGTVTANYEYGPFAEPIRMSGAMAKVNPFRFSTKYQDDETELLYYGYRYYSPSLGRWLSRDPIGEKYGLNLFSFVRNAAPDAIDPLGLEIQSSCPIDSYLSELGFTAGTDYQHTEPAEGLHSYKSSREVSAGEGPDLTKLIVVRMMKSNHPFVLARGGAGEIENLKHHVAIRRKVVFFTLIFEPTWFDDHGLPGRGGALPTPPLAGASESEWLAWFYVHNKPSTKLRCDAAAKMIIGQLGVVWVLFRFFGGSAAN